MIFNYATILSSFDKRGTLMKQLQDMENAFDSAGLTGVEVVDSTATSLKLKFNFEDGTSMTTSAIDIKGAKGDTGDPATVAVGTVSTLPAGSSATVTNSGTASNAVLNFGIPKGDTGTAGGITNINGYTGAVTTGKGIAFDTATGALSSYDLNLVDTGSVNLANLSPLPSGITSLLGNIRWALNEDKSIGKIYGYFRCVTDSVATDTTIKIPLGISVSAPTAAYTIYTGMLSRWADTTYAVSQYGLTFNIDASGNVFLQFTITASQGGHTFWNEYPACLYFFKDFGDEQNNRSFAMRMNALNIDPVDSEVR